MSNKIETVSIGDLPIATELDDADELLLRDVSATLPENATARLSIATLRAAMGGGADDWSEFPATSSVDMDGHGLTNLPAPSAASDAATKGYVDARPGAEEWSEYAATQDVDLDGHKITGLGEPTDAADAATKGYVDGAAGRNTYWGEYEGANSGHLPNGTYNPLSGDDYDRLKVGDIATLRIPGSTGRVALYRCQTRGNEGGAGGIAARWRAITPESDDDNNAYMYVRTLRATEINNHVDGFTRRRDVADWSFVSGPAGNAAGKRFANLGSPENNSDAATKGYVDGKVASMPAPPDLEWWDPVWTPVNNVDSVANVECSYTRAYRAAGGSLVTMEGTIEVTPDAAGQCSVQVDLPVARVGSGLLAGTAMAMGDAPPIATVAMVDSTRLALVFTADSASPYVVGFRASYRAA